MRKGREELAGIPIIAVFYVDFYSAIKDHIL